MSRITRRDWLQAGALLGSMPCACLAKASNDCCTVPEILSDAVHVEPGLIAIDLDRTRLLSRIGSAVKIVDATRKIRIIVARCAQDEFVALDQKCTHGGGALTYVHRHKHLYCTCWGHSIFALDGSVLRWPNKQTPRPLRAHPVERRQNILEIRVDGLA